MWVTLNLTFKVTQVKWKGVIGLPVQSSLVITWSLEGIHSGLHCMKGALSVIASLIISLGVGGWVVRLDRGFLDGKSPCKRVWFFWHIPWCRFFFTIRLLHLYQLRVMRLMQGSLMWLKIMGCFVFVRSTFELQLWTWLLNSVAVHFRT